MSVGQVHCNTIQTILLFPIDFMTLQVRGASHSSSHVCKPPTFRTARGTHRAKTLNHRFVRFMCVLTRATRSTHFELNLHPVFSTAHLVSVQSI